MDGSVNVFSEGDLVKLINAHGKEGYFFYHSSENGPQKKEFGPNGLTISQLMREIQYAVSAGCSLLIHKQASDEWVGYEADNINAQTSPITEGYRLSSMDSGKIRRLFSEL